MAIALVRSGPVLASISALLDIYVNPVLSDSVDVIITCPFHANNDFSTSSFALQSNILHNQHTLDNISKTLPIFAQDLVINQDNSLLPLLDIAPCATNVTVTAASLFLWFEFEPPVMVVPSYQIIAKMGPKNHLCYNLVGIIYFARGHFLPD